MNTMTLRCGHPTSNISFTLGSQRPTIYFKTFFRFFWCMLKFENHCSNFNTEFQAQPNPQTLTWRRWPGLNNSESTLVNSNVLQACVSIMKESPRINTYHGSLHKAGHEHSIASSISEILWINAWKLWLKKNKGRQPKVLHHKKCPNQTPVSFTGWAHPDSGPCTVLLKPLLYNQDHLGTCLWPHSRRYS